MEKLELEVSKRDVTGKKVRFMRREGKTPAIIYGPKIESQPVMADAKKMGTVLRKAGGTDLISLTIEGSKAVKVLVREVQREPLTDKLLHVDFYQVDLTQKIKAEIPLVFVGEAPALKKKNTSIIHTMDSVEVEALPDHLPHNIEVDLTLLVDMDSAIHVKDLKVSKDVTILSDMESAIARAIEAKVEVEAPVAAAAEGAEAAAAEGAEGAAEGEGAPAAKGGAAPAAGAKAAPKKE